MSVQGVAEKLQRNIEIQQEKTGLNYHNLQVTGNMYVEKVVTNLRHKLERSEKDEIFELKTSVLIWGLFVTTTMKSAVQRRTSKRSRRYSISL